MAERGFNFVRLPCPYSAWSDRDQWLTISDAAFQPLMKRSNSLDNILFTWAFPSTWYRGAASTRAISNHSSCSIAPAPQWSRLWLRLAITGSTLRSKWRS